MKSPAPSKNDRRGSKQGMALVITLMFMVLLVFLVMAFLDSANNHRMISSSSASQIQTAELARSAVEFISDQLASEIRDAAKSEAVTNTSGGVSYLPKAAKDQVPERAGIPPNSGTNLVKMSSTDAPALYSGGRTVVSPGAPSTDTASLNGLSLGFDYWFGTNATTGRGPHLGTNAGGALPSWVYVTRTGVDGGAFDGTLHAVGGTNEVIGRFAFVVYDVGGLIDLNVAGRPASLPPNEASGGGSLAFADLTMLGLTQAQVDEIVGLRSAPLSSSASAFRDYFLKPGTATNFHPADKGYLAVPQGHLPFLSRAHLIRLFQSKDWDTAALEKLTHFSRDVESPSFDPTILPFPRNTGSNDRAQYAKDAGLTLLPPARAALTVGEKLRRFPLARIAWLENKANDPSDSSKDDKIREAFGLQYDSNSGAWNYVEGDLASGLVGFRIKTLDQVAALNRQPNFFEMLKAAIYPGSLGSSNPYNNSLKATQSSLARAGTSAGFLFDRNTDLQIIRIGANIIDQWDKDSFPTEIRLGPVGFYGIEDLPYFSAVTFKAHRDIDVARSPTGNDPPPVVNDLVVNPGVRWEHYVLFELWNPHQPSTNSTSTARPSNIRVKAVSGTVESYINWGSGATTNSTGGANPDRRGGDTPRVSTTFSGQTLVPVSGFGPDSFRSPAYAKNAGDASFVSKLGHNAFALTPMPQMQLGSQGPPSNVNQGISAAIRYIRPDNNVFALEYERNGVWRTYAAFHGFPELPTLSGWNTGPNFNSDIEIMSGNTRARYPQSATLPEVYANAYHHPEPRSNRWGGARSWTPWPGDGGLSANEGFLPLLSRQQLTVDGRQSAEQVPWAPQWNIANDWYHQASQFGVRSSPNNSSGAFGILEPTVSAGSSHTHPGLLYKNDPASTAQYSYARDPDGTVRPADGYFVPAANNPSARSGPGAALASTARPVILNRAFRSVGELGFAFRDQPWKSLDMFSPSSADAGLLDYFCIDEVTTDNNEPPLVAGRISLNTPHADSLASILSGISRFPGLSNSKPLTADEARTAAAAIVANTRSSAGPLRNRAELVARLDTLGLPDTLLGQAKAERETIVRALNAVGQTRVWNFLVDVTAQSGKIPRGSSGLQSFTVEGQRRFWVDLSIDRLTGKVLHMSFTRPVE